MCFCIVCERGNIGGVIVTQHIMGNGVELWILEEWKTRHCQLRRVCDIVTRASFSYRMSGCIS